MKLHALIAAFVYAPALYAQASWSARVTPSFVSEATGRGGWTVGALNWFAGGYRTGVLSFDAMLSAEPYTLDNCGYTHILASDPNCASSPRDIQAAHPLLMRASVSVQKGALLASAALAGEPALGPATYMHRTSARFDPIAPYTDHLTNAYHAAYSVFTLGVASSRFGAAASAFDTRERHSEPKAIDPAMPDAGSLRLTFAASKDVRFSVSGADLPASAHAGHGGAAATERTRIGFLTAEHTRGNIALLGVVGWHDVGPGLRVGLLEATFTQTRFALFSRVEVADAIDERLTVVIQPSGEHTHIVDALRSTGGQFGVGGVLRQPVGEMLEVDLGLRGWLSVIPKRRQDQYDQRRTAPGVAAFVTLAAGSRGEHHHH